MPIQEFNLDEIKAKYGYGITAWGESLLELGKWMDDVEGRLIREGKLQIVNGKYHWLTKNNKREKPVL